MISLNQVSYKAGKKTLLADINLEVQKGEMLAVIGANGAGKSTLMKLLSGDQQAHTGEVRLDDEHIKTYSMAALALRRAVLSQHNTLSVSFLVEEIVMMGRYPHFNGQPSSHDVDIVKSVMNETGVKHLAGRDYSTLSGGEQQRVQLARVIAQIYDIDGAYLFLDEPTNGLDLLYQQQILNTARHLADKGFGVVAILHDINFASRYADRVLILKEGRILALGTPNEVITAYSIQEAFGVQMALFDAYGCKYPFVIPKGIV
ncbi:heme ABC transporter ATP-binding protein [Mucilaginibacter aquatilis]|uniref:Heme ABC transporter ATP-binding protein n=1 Tax=Mucilaginibacter aquatilis TaxID=1517760 RepID=A0A6I4IQQ6_9SPHI|nr:heme ABC transporter ATP-binding protein [Mucilaginibacter aquatilis]MVN91554.1 heme ABC transporter ATP-binding protein [Mucilaginibacter aquatilis]